MGLEFGMERDVEVTGDERLFVGMTLLKPLVYTFSSMSAGRVSYKCTNTYLCMLQYKNIGREMGDG